MKVQRPERQRILRGDLRPLVRRTRPDIDAGRAIVLQWITFRPTIDEAGKPCAPPRQIGFQIIVTRVVRRREGGWLIHFDVDDHREAKRFVRRRPPTRNADWDGQDHTKPPSADEIEKASTEGNYASSAHGAVDHLEAVPAEYQESISARARGQFAVAQEAEHLNEKRRKEFRALTVQAKETAVDLARAGVDPTPMLAEVRSVLDRARAELEAAA